MNERTRCRPRSQTSPSTCRSTGCRKLLPEEKAFSAFEARESHYMHSAVASLQRELSGAPVPDWQRRREPRLTPGVVLPHLFEAPHRSLLRTNSFVQSAPRLWAKLAIEVAELNRMRFRSRRVGQDTIVAASTKGRLLNDRHPDNVSNDFRSWIVRL